MRWVRRWRVTVRWDHPRNSHKGVKTWSMDVHTAARERQIVAWALANPHVEEFKSTPVWVLDGELPAQCRRGHRYPVGQAANHEPYRRWHRCTCGGHFVLTCPDTRCRDVVVEPQVLVDCQPPPR